MTESSQVKKHPKKIQTAEELMQSVANGDRDAFTTLVQTHQNSILNFIWRLMGDKTQAEDLSQDVFLRVWKSAPKYEKSAKFSTWIYRIATNLCLNKMRTLKIKNMFLTPLPLKRQPQINTDSTTPENQLLKRDIRKKLSAFQDEEVNQVQKENIEIHLQSCQECKKQFAEMIHTYQSIEKLPQIEHDPVFTRQVMARINNTSLLDHFLKKFLRPLPVPAAMTAMVIIGLLSGTLLGNLVIQNQLNSLELSSTANYPDKENIVTSLSIDSFNAVPPGSIADSFLHVTLGSNMNAKNHGVSL